MSYLVDEIAEAADILREIGAALERRNMPREVERLALAGREVAKVLATVQEIEAAQVPERLCDVQTEHRTEWGAQLTIG